MGRGSGVCEGAGLLVFPVRECPGLLENVIMNPFSFSPTAGTSLFYRLGLDENFNERVCLNHFFNKNTFQVKESLGILRVHL